VLIIGQAELEDEFEKIQSANYTLYVHKDFRDRDFEKALLGGEKALGKKFRLRAVRSSRFAKVYRFGAELNGVGRVVYFKEFLSRSVWDSFKHIFRASRARRALEGSLMLNSRGFGVPAVIAMGESKRGPFVGGDFLVTLEVENSKQVYQFLGDNSGNLNSEEVRSKHKLLRDFGKTVGKMHAAGIFHGDLRVGNVLASFEKDGWEFFFLDNERTKWFCRLPNRLRLKNLVQVNMHRVRVLTNSDRLRFFKSYLEAEPALGDGWKEWARLVVKKTDCRLKKNRRRKSGEWALLKG